MRRAFATVIAAPSVFIREEITRVLSSSEFRIVAAASRIDEPLVSSLPDKESLLLLVIDIGIDAARSVGQMRLFKERYPGGRIAVLADRYQLDDVLLAYPEGANAYLPKTSAGDVLLKSLELVVLGDTIVPSTILPWISGYASGCDPENSDKSIFARQRRYRLWGHQRRLDGPAGHLLHKKRGYWSKCQSLIVNGNPTPEQADVLLKRLIASGVPG
jgi:two-component system nitrate/nitrite response regulator NarL